MLALGTAYCRNCGKVAMVDEEDILNDEQKIDHATDNCDCEESTKKRKVVEEIKKQRSESWNSSAMNVSTLTLSL